jgi:hypothetical protein
MEAKNVELLLFGVVLDFFEIYVFAFAVVDDTAFTLLGGIFVVHLLLLCAVERMVDAANHFKDKVNEGGKKEKEEKFYDVCALHDVLILSVHCACLLLSKKGE